MIKILGHEHLPSLARGFSLLGSGGGGKTTLQELILAGSHRWPITLHQASDLDPSLPCVGAAFVGSTHFLLERLPSTDPFGPLLKAAERWSGAKAQAVCALEGAGLNGLTALDLATDYPFVDADFTGRAFPNLDQLSLYVDKVPGVFAVCDTGAGGVVVVDVERAADMEKIVRSAIVQAGGVAPFLLAGFTVGDLLEHAITGIYQRALSLGEAFDAASDGGMLELATLLGGQLLGQGRVTTVDISQHEIHDSTIEVTGNDGRIMRVIARSEFLAFMDSGRVLAATPEIIVVLNSVSRTVMQVDEVTPGRDVSIISLPAPEWWYEKPERLQHVQPKVFGLDGLETMW